MNNHITLLQGDITLLKVDAIVNAANSSLMGGGGVDGAIHRAGGRQILEECIRIVDTQGSCPAGNAVITNGGKLPAKYVIHTVGPVWKDGKNDEEKLLTSCYKNSLNIAADNGLKSIAFPNISTGIYHFPKKLAAAIAVKTVNDFLHDHSEIEQVIFICYDGENFSLYKKLLSGDD